MVRLNLAVRRFAIASGIVLHLNLPSGASVVDDGGIAPARQSLAAEQERRGEWETSVRLNTRSVSRETTPIRCCSACLQPPDPL
jgi:hypothetical protein